MSGNDTISDNLLVCPCKHKYIRVKEFSRNMSYLRHKSTTGNWQQALQG